RPSHLLYPSLPPCSVRLDRPCSVWNVLDRYFTPECGGRIGDPSWRFVLFVLSSGEGTEAGNSVLCRRHVAGRSPSWPIWTRGTQRSKGASRPSVRWLLSIGSGQF